MLLAEDRPLDASRMIREAMERWGQNSSHSGVNLLECFAWWGEIDVLLYEGHTEQAWVHCEHMWPRANRRSSVLHVMLRVLTNWARARCAVAMALVCKEEGVRPRKRSCLKVAARMARKLERGSGKIVGPPHGWLIRAAIAHQGGKDAQAMAYLERAEIAFEKFGMALHLAAARRRRGELLGGETGRGMIVAVDTDLVERGIQKPARFATMYAPGFRNDTSKK